MAGQPVQVKEYWNDEVLHVGWSQQATPAERTPLGIVGRDAWIEDFVVRFSTGQSLLGVLLKVVPPGEAPDSGTPASSTVPVTGTNQMKRATIHQNANFVPEGSALYLQFTSNPTSVAGLVVDIRLTTQRR